METLLPMLQAEMLSRVGPPGIDVPVKNTPADGNSCDPRDTNQHAMCQQWCGSLPGGLEQQAIHCDRTILKHAIGTAEDQGPDTGLPHSAGPEADAQVPDNTARDTSSAEDSNSQDTICEAHARKALRSLARMVMCCNSEALKWQLEQTTGNEPVSGTQGAQSGQHNLLQAEQASTRLLAKLQDSFKSRAVPVPIRKGSKSSGKKQRVR